jgi:FHA domain-containing protein
MINLTVTTFNDRPVANLSASFDELGGTIGRSKTNQLVLPDPDRVVSRVHAKIVFRGGSYCLVACGGNALRHNQTVVNPGSEVGLSVGDRIQIEGYSIAVTAAEVKEVSDPFAALFERDQEAKAPLMSAPPSVPPARPSPAMAPSPAIPAARSKGGIPEDWDPFARNDGAQDRTPLGAAQPMQGAFLERDLPATSPADSIDSLFGLQEQSPGQLAKVLGVPDAQPNTAGHSDPLRSLDAPAKVAAMPVSDHVADLNAPWVNRTANAGSADTIPIPKGAVLSWTAGVHEARIAGRPADDSVLDLGAPAAPERKPMMEPRLPAGGDTAREQARTVPPRQALPAAQVDELLEGLLEGLAIPGLQIERLTPELMTQLGQLLREATKGTVELLAIRAALKREIRADVTIINASENNPLKFSPDVDGAMQLMLGQRMRGFMAPVDSMRDAFQDLRAHELGIMAGMKAALAGVLLRFDPNVLEGKLARSSSISDLIPSPRKARLWNQFEALYKQLADEAEADFNTMFGKAFLKAYESYIGQLEDPKKNE